MDEHIAMLPTFICTYSNLLEQVETEFITGLSTSGSEKGEKVMYISTFSPNMLIIDLFPFCIVRTDNVGCVTLPCIIVRSNTQLSISMMKVSNKKYLRKAIQTVVLYLSQKEYLRGT